MQTITNDFTGSYDWPATEAYAEAETYRDWLAMEGVEYVETVLIPKLRAHWSRVFGSDEQGQADMARFSEVFNTELAEYLNVKL